MHLKVSDWSENNGIWVILKCQILIQKHFGHIVTAQKKNKNIYLICY